MWKEMYAHKQDIKKHRQTCTNTVSNFLINERTLELMRQKKKLSTYLDEYICEYICLTIKKKKTCNYYYYYYYYYYYNFTLGVTNYLYACVKESQNKVIH